MGALRIATYALVANALLGVAIEVNDDLPVALLLVGIIAFVLLDVVALAAIATLRHDLSAWAEVGVLAWGIGLLASAYSTTWVVWYLIGGHPSFEVGPMTYVTEQLGRTIGQACIVIALARAAGKRMIHLAAAVWGGIAIGAFVLFLQLYWDDMSEPDPTLRLVREVMYSGSLIVLAWIATTAGRIVKEREPAPARVVS